MNKFDKAYHSVISEMNEQIMKQLGFSQQVNDVHNGICPFCKTPININDFRDQLSRKEYKISGLCQKCQDQVFSSEDEENDFEDEYAYQKATNFFPQLRERINNKIDNDRTNSFVRDFAAAVANYASDKGLSEVFEMMTDVADLSSRDEILSAINNGQYEIQEAFGTTAASYLPDQDLEQVYRNNQDLFEEFLQNEDYSFYSPMSPSDI